MVRRLRSDTISAEALQTILERDRRFDLFADAAVSGIPGGPFVRPAILWGDNAVWGFRYRSVLPGLAGDDLPVLRVPDEGETSLSGLTELALAAEGRGGSYRWSEIDRVVALVESDPTCDTGVLEGVRHALDPVRDVLEMLARYRRLPEALRDPLDTGTIDIRTAEAVPADLLPRMQALLAGTAGLTFSERRQAIRIIVDLLRRGDHSAEDAIALVEAHRGADLLPVLRRIRYPGMTGLDDAIARFRGRYTQGTGISVSYPENYEGDAVTVSFRLRSSKELEGRIAALRRMEDGIDELLGLLL